MPEQPICPQCGASLPINSPEGICPQCLLRAGLASEPAATTPSPQQGADAPRSPGHGGFVPPGLDEIARAFPQLEVLELIGRGGMGAVYKARQRELDRLVALKILPPEVGQDPAFAQRFAREARALAKLNHPHIVTIFDSGQSGGLYYLMMEYVDGVNLRQTIRAGELKSTEALAIVPQICDALQYAHDEGIVHRDIKPENILVDKRGRVKIADFGLAKLLASGGRESPEAVSLLTATAQVMGTLRYMAPEQMESAAHVDHRADIYSLGVVFYELLTGEVPMGRFEPPSQRVEVDVRLDEIVLRTLEREPARRYQRASELKSDVQTVTSSPARLPAAQAASRAADARDVSIADIDLESARQEVKVPATALLVVGVFYLVLCVIPLCVLPAAWFLTPMAASPTEGWTYYLFLLLTSSFLAHLPLSLLMVIGGWRMQRLESHGLAVLASLVALLPCQPLWPLGFIVGIWSLIVLNRPHIKAAFAGQAKLRVARGSSGAGSTAGRDSSASRGRPLAQIRFVVDDACDVGPQAIFHFSALGYELIEQQPDVCIFQRGHTSGGLWSTDIRQLHTRLTVRTATAANGQRWVSCDWSVRTLGSWITRRDIQTLESEGRGLQAMLVTNAPTAAIVDHAAPPWSANADEPRTHLAAQRSARNEVDGPSAGLIIVGGLTVVAHGGFFLWGIQNDPRPWDWPIWFSLIGIPFGFVTLLGGIGMRQLGSLGLATLGGWAAVTPVSPLALLGIPLGVWALIALRKDHVRQGFNEAMEQRDAAAARVFASGTIASRDDLERLIVESLHVSKIEAIRVYRKATGAHLPEAKAAVEMIATLHGIRDVPLTQRQRLLQVALPAAALAVAAGVISAANVSPFVQGSVILGGAALLLFWYFAFWMAIRSERAAAKAADERTKHPRLLWGAGIVGGCTLIAVSLLLAFWLLRREPVGDYIIYDVVAEGSPGASTVDMDALVEAVNRRVNTGLSNLANVSASESGATPTIEIAIYGHDPNVRRQIVRRMEALGTLELRILAHREIDTDIVRLAQETTSDGVLDQSTGAETTRRRARWVPATSRWQEENINNQNIVTRTSSDGHQQVLVLLGTSDVVHGDVDRVNVVTDELASPALFVKFNSQGAQRMAKLTSGHVSTDQRARHLAIIIDGRLESSPRIMAPLTSSAMLTGNFTPEEAADLAAVLQAGKLPTKLVLSSHTLPKAFDGEWVCVYFERDGVEVTLDNELSSTFSGEEFVVKQRGQIVVAGTSKVNPNKQPQEIDTTYTAGELQGQTIKGIRKIEGERITYCRAASADDPRPTEFKTTPGSGRLVTIYERRK